MKYITIRVTHAKQGYIAGYLDHNGLLDSGNTIITRMTDYVFYDGEKIRQAIAKHKRLSSPVYKYSRVQIFKKE